MIPGAGDEIARGERYAFGANWSRFLRVLTDTRIRLAEESLCHMLEVSDLRGMRFLDIGSGSGLFSLAARRLGASVTSFDYDPASVACTQELRRRFFPDDPDWQIEHGSVLDGDYVRSKGQFDIVYSWGVLHHTGSMWRALAHAALAVAPGGSLFVAIYNDQGGASRRWHWVKRVYCSGMFGRALVCAVCIPYFVLFRLAADIKNLENPFRGYFSRTSRGMSVFYNWFDWLGGLPFEVAKPEAIIRFYRDRNFVLRNLETAGGGHGNNQFVFTRR